MREIGHKTGGQAIDVRNLTDGVLPLLASIDSQWAVSLVPAQSPDQKLHSLNVWSSQKDILISAPTHIFLH